MFTWFPAALPSPPQPSLPLPAQPLPLPVPPGQDSALPATELSAKRCWTARNSPSRGGGIQLRCTEVCVNGAFGHIILFKALVVVVSQFSHGHWVFLRRHRYFLFSFVFPRETTRTSRSLGNSCRKSKHSKECLCQSGIFGDGVSWPPSKWMSRLCTKDSTGKHLFKILLKFIYIELSQNFRILMCIGNLPKGIQ